MATTDSVTAVVAAKEEVKQAVADDLNSVLTTPCEWFICDDDQTGTRFFVIQGSESLASWQANLLFEPISFEVIFPFTSFYCLVSFELASEHEDEYVARSPFPPASSRRTCHIPFHRAFSRGKLVPACKSHVANKGCSAPSSLLPVITFGAPSIMCGGDHLLHELGLPRSHVQAVTMHRDIVPRAFSCNYPSM
ncbi:hypothetical protein CK203_068299 [Vitis vinifera]|uniref:Uncharacterized protein n=1 Tax=Vitis vinifera TaxID=29760 RepID=A0A438E1S4_VITVI|nr:hypothetical protein CK203_068299 [Vitis vinifera]